jgi:hypothetical protein
MLHLDADRPDSAAGGRVLPKAAALSFMLGILALRVCWLPGVNCALAAASLAVGTFAFVQVLRAHGRTAGLEEALTGMVLGLVVLGLSVFFISAVVVAYR